MPLKLYRLQFPDPEGDCKNWKSSLSAGKTTVVVGAKDTSIFDLNSVKLIYSLPKGSYIL